MDRTLKEEALKSVSEMNCILNKLSGMFSGLESSLKKALITATKEPSRSTYSEQLAASIGPQSNHHPLLHPSGDSPQTAGLVIKPTDQNTTSQEIKKLIKEAVDPKTLQLGVNRIKNLSNNALFIECRNKVDCDIMERELKKMQSLTVESPKRRLPTLLLLHVPADVEDSDIKDIILQQNDLSDTENPILNVKFTKRRYNDSRHIVIEVSPTLRRKLIALRGVKIMWSMCKIEDFILVTRCMKCLGFGHTHKYCDKQQKCTICAGEHYWKECDNKHNICCSNCLIANTYIHDNSKKLRTDHSVFGNECPRLRRIKSIVINKTEY